MKQKAVKKHLQGQQEPLGQALEERDWSLIQLFLARMLVGGSG